jgi:hypothetical protein
VPGSTTRIGSINQARLRLRVVVIAGLLCGVNSSALAQEAAIDTAEAATFKGSEQTRRNASDSLRFTADAGAHGHQGHAQGIGGRLRQSADKRKRVMGRSGWRRSTGDPSR